MSNSRDDAPVQPVSDREERRVYHAYHDATGAGDVSDTVIAAVADVADVDPTTTRIPLADAVDPDALDAIFAERVDGTSRDGGRVTFDVCGLQIVVYGNGHVLISEEP